MKHLTTLAIFALSLIANAAPAEKELTLVRIGWQVPWATQGQLVQIWKHTEILQKNGLKAEFIGKLYGPVLNEAALAGALDVLLTADQPAAALFAKDKGWVGIGRLMYNRTSTYVPPRSSIQNMRDLRGKTIGVPMGAAAERVTAAALKRNGIDPQKDAKMINLDIREQGPLVNGGTEAKAWGQFDALSGFDPMPAIFEAKGWVRVLDIGAVCSLVVMNEAYLNKHDQVATRLMQALVDAYDYYRQNREQANAWFLEEAHLDDADQKACTLAASLEPNLKVKSRAGIRVSFNEDDFKLLQTAADFLEPKLKKHIDMRKFVTNKYLSELH